MTASRVDIRFCVLVLFLLFLIGLRPSTLRAEDGFPTVSLWPLAYSNEEENRVDTDVLWPLFHYERQDTRTYWTLRPWLVSSETDPQRDYSDRWLLTFLFHSEHQGNEYRRHIFPVYWQGDWDSNRWFYLWPLYGRERSDNDRERYDGVLPPLFGYSRNVERGTSRVDWLWPLGQVEKRRDGNSNRFFPLWHFDHSGERRTGYVFPYYWQRDPARNRSEDAIIPLWYRSSKGDRHFSLFIPFWMHQKSPDEEMTMLLPLWYSRRSDEERFATLFPLHYRWDTPDLRLRLTLPLHASYRSSAHDFDMIFPFWFRHQNLNEKTDLYYLLPFYGAYTRGETYRRNFVLFPLYSGWRDRQSGESGWSLLWPLVHYEQTPTGFESWLLPLFWIDRSGDDTMTMALGLWWSRHWEDGYFRLLAPLYIDYDRNGSGQTHLLPLYSELHRSDGYRKRFILGPLWIDTRDPRHDMSQTDILWPLYSHGRQKDRSHLRVLPFYWQEESPDSSFRLASAAFLPPYYVDIRDGNERIWQLWPFYGFRSAPGYREDSVIWPLLRYGRSEDGRRSSWQLLTAYSDRNGNDGFSGLFPLWHHTYGANSSDTITLISWWRSRGESERQFSLLHLGDPDFSLFTVSRRGEQRHQHLLPLFWNSSNPQAQEQDLAVAWPLYTYRQRGEATRHRLLWKLLYTESAPERSERGFLWRLIHSKRDANEQIFEFNPFYYREAHADGEIYSTWLGGLYSTLKHAGGTRTTLLWFIRFGEPRAR